MLIIERYLAREILRPVTAVGLLLVTVVLIFYAGDILARAAGEGMPAGQVAHLMVLRLGLFLDVLIPVALLIGIVVGLGRLQSYQEVTALAATGGGRRRIIRALTGAVLLVALVVALLSILFRPWGYAEIYRMEADLAMQLNLDRVEPGRFQVGDAQWLIHAGQRDGEALIDVMVHQRLPEASTVLRSQRLWQESATDGSQRLIFSGDVRIHRLTPGDDPDVSGRLERFEVQFTPPPPPERTRLRRALPMDELLAYDDGVHLAELQWRAVSPLTVLVLALAGLAMARIHPRHGQSTRVLGATLLATLYFSLLGMLTNWLEAERVAAWPGLFLVPAGVVVVFGMRYLFTSRGPGPPL